MKLQFSPLALEDSDVPPTEAERRRRINRVVRARVARWQHENVIAMRLSLKNKGLTQTAYADLTGESVRRIGSILRGEAVMRLDDVERADQLIGVSHAFVQRFERLRKLAETQAIIEEIERNSEPWPEPDPADSPGADSTGPSHPE